MSYYVSKSNLQKRGSYFAYPRCARMGSIFWKIAQLVPNMKKDSAKAKLLPLPPESHFPHHFFIDRHGGTGTNSPVVRELTFILLLAGEWTKKKGYRNDPLNGKKTPFEIALHITDITINLKRLWVDGRFSAYTPLRHHTLLFAYSYVWAQDFLILFMRPTSATVVSTFISSVCHSIFLAWWYGNIWSKSLDLWWICMEAFPDPKSPHTTVNPRCSRRAQRLPPGLHMNFTGSPPWIPTSNSSKTLEFKEILRGERVPLNQPGSLEPASFMDSTSC